MKKNLVKLTSIFAMLLGVLLVINSTMVIAGSDNDVDKSVYQVTIHNLTGGQPFSPPVAATHRYRISMFNVGELASGGLEAIAEDGDNSMMFKRFDESDDATDAVDVGMPVMTNGMMAGGLPIDAATFQIHAGERDRFSFAAMLICTNDGFVGLDRAGLPRTGSLIYLLSGYDANTEMNTQMSEDIVDPCSGIGPFALPGDPNGNEDEAVDMMPHLPIALHPGITDSGDLTVADHGWTDPAVKVTITRLNGGTGKFVAQLSGAGEVPPVHTFADGIAQFKLDLRNKALRYLLSVNNIEDVIQAHIHIGKPNMNRDVVAFLYGFVDPPTGFVNGDLVEGAITEDDLMGPFKDNFEGFVSALTGGSLYVNVHTAAVPSGEIRGQIGAN